MTVTRDRVSHTVCKQSRADTIARAYAPGQRLVEDRLAAEFGISQVPIREALRVLVAEGFVYTKANSGTFVAEYRFRTGTASP